MKVAVLALAVFAAAGVSAAQAGPASPYVALLSSGYPDTSLPAAFSSARIVPASPGHVAARVVVFDVNGPDPNDGVLFAVFKSPAAASADLSAALPVVDGLELHPAGKVPGQPVSQMFRGTSTTRDALNDQTVQGVTYAVVPYGNVLVAGFTYSVYAKTGNPGGARKLVVSGLAHVKRLAPRSG